MLSTERFQPFIKENRLFEVGEKILLAVSGGKDSVLMAALFKDLGVDFGIAHCNFNLRGTESDEDERFVADLAERYQVTFHRVKFDTKDYAKKHQISIQMAARELRYQWLEEIREKYRYHYIALAHHQNDVVETVLLNLVRGTGIAGLHGILPKRGNLIRPLLFLKREEIDNLVAQLKLPYREDSSNLSTKYARNKIRLEVIPKLKELNPSLEDTFQKNSKRFAQIEEFLAVKVEELRNKLVIPEGISYKINIEKLKQLQPLSLLLFELLKPFNFSEAVLEDLVRSWNGQSGKLFQSNTHQILLDRNYLILSPLQTEKDCVVLVKEGDELIDLNDSIVKVEEISSANLILEKNPCKLYLDAKLLHYPLKFRYWKEGDYFFPFGMKGKKKLSDFFTGLKIPLTEKHTIPILENGNGDIVWVAGYRSDERYKVTPTTEKIITLEIQKK